MKISPMKGFGSYGQFVDDADFDNMSDEEWLELGRSHLKNLVTVFRNPKITNDQWYANIQKLGPLKANLRLFWEKKYGRQLDALDESTWEGVEEQDLMYIKSKKYMLEETEGGNFLTRVYGQKDEDGNLQGQFSSGDVDWHHNESGLITFTPEVSLKGGEHMVGSATGFLQTVDYYENVSDSFRSELDEMVLLHKYKQGSINEEEDVNPMYRTHLQLGFCPVDGSEVPMVCTSPGGIRGLHWGVNTSYQVKGMSQTESDKLFESIQKELFVDDYIYDHYYTQDNDFLMFDNSICLHRRVGGDPDRKAYRMQYDPSNILDSAWYPFEHMPEFNTAYIDRVNELQDILDLPGFKRPVHSE